MLWTLNQARRLRSDDHWLNHYWGKAIFALVLLFSFPTLATNAWTYAYNDYWGVSGWRQLPNLLTPTLEIVKNGNSVAISFPNGSPIPTNDFRVVLQTTTSLSPESEWTTVTNVPTTIPYSGISTVTLPADEPQRFFRFAVVETNRFPIFQFAIFYDGQLEFTQSAPLSIRGRTHANGPICMGAASGNTLLFDRPVTTASSIVVSNIGGYSSFATPVYAGTPAYRTNTPQLHLSGVISNRTIIEVPPIGESPSNWQNYYNMAAVVLLISNTTVSVNVKVPGAAAATGIVSNYTFWSYSNSNPNALVYGASNIVHQRTNLAAQVPFLNLTNRFRDYRENKWVMPTDINMAVLKNWLVTNSAVLNKFPLNSGTYPTIMYVGDFRTVTNLHAVRLLNGSIIPTNGPSHTQAQGFTLATVNPIYVWGHYNTPNPSHQGTINVSATFPASLVGDAITILSPNWTDNVYGNGITSLSSRSAISTTVNAAIIAGSVYTTGPAVGQWSGGLQNLTRLLESWNGRTLTLNTSHVNLYPSLSATTQFQNPGVYYHAPTRNFNFNTNYLLEPKLPPGTPVVVGTTPLD